MKFWKEDAKNGVIVFRKKNTDVSCKLISLILENDNGKMEENIENSKKERKKKKKEKCSLHLHVSRRSCFAEEHVSLADDGLSGELI